MFRRIYTKPSVNASYKNSAYRIGTRCFVFYFRMKVK